MKASELRIGNWVLSHSDTPVQIQAGGINAMEHGQFHPKPIPLTSDILYINGWTDDDGPVLLVGEFQISFRDGYIRFWWFFDHEASIKVKLDYVHQLQNAVFAITGTEITFSSLPAS